MQTLTISEHWTHTIAYHIRLPVLHGVIITFLSALTLAISPAGTALATVRSPFGISVSLVSALSSLK
ncbi:hypothetical protein SKAU_G00076090 [Synaphobranchus kaupii]|uniref:Uncharacterized protein n=1 Tax=Synaphobranchus kaupii TaxID=118154 RepID=A0A9Q1G7Q3_SYNKA|nr:hypothetical protein SKAU_G00076090 [Synaphobranchus kaupii]